MFKMKRLEVSCAIRHIYIYVVSRLRVNNGILNPDALNHFSTAAKTISGNISGITNDSSKPTQYLKQTFKSPFPIIKFNNTSTKEIEKKIIYSLQTNIIMFMMRFQPS
jgi:hypothetical protein